MKKDIICIGGQGFIKECIYYLSLKDDVKLKGLVSYDSFIPDVKNINYLGKIDDYTIEDNDYFIICAGAPDLRAEIYHKLKEKKAKFYTLLHKTVLNDTVKIGEANIFVECRLTVDIEIGNGNLFNIGATVGHDAKIGDFNFIAPYVQVLGNGKVGSKNSIGTHSCLLPGSKIGNGNKIAPLSAIYKGCKDNCYMLGNPALKVGTV